MGGLLQVGFLWIALQAGGSQDTCDPTQVWEEMIMAKGGRARLEAVSALHVVESYGPWYSRGRTKTLLLFPDFYWTWHKNAPFATKVIKLDLRRGMQWDCFGGGECKVSSPRAPNLMDWMQLVYLLETRWMKPKPVACVIRTEGNQQVTSLQVSVGQIQAEFLIPAPSHLPRTVKVSPDPSQVRLENYKMFKGVMMPSKLAYGPNPKVWCKMQYEIDPKYDPTFRNAEPPRQLSISDSEPWRPGRSRY